MAAGKSKELNGGLSSPGANQKSRGTLKSDMDVHSHTKFQIKFRVRSLACVEGEQRYCEKDAKPLDFDGLC